MKIVTNNFRLNMAQEFVELASTPNTSIFYVFNGRSYPFSNTVNTPGSDVSPPLVFDNNDDTLYDLYDDMLYGKRVLANDISLMIKKHEWVANTVYAKYDNRDTELFEKEFYVINSNNAVFKCLDNNKGAPSTDEPIIEDSEDQIYFTSDGYQWKYMYTACNALVAKFATNQYFPFVENANTTANAVAGAIDVVEINQLGPLKYTATTSGIIQEIDVGGNPQVIRLESNASSVANIYVDSVVYLSSGTGFGQQRKIVQYDSVLKHVLLDQAFNDPPVAGNTFYQIVPNVAIYGDGAGARARAVINSVSKSLEKVIVTDRGAGYTYAVATVEGYSTVSANSTNLPILRVIKPPRGGHGRNQAAELGSRWACISTNISSENSNGKVINKNDFRTIGVLKDPLLREVTLTINPGNSSVGSVGDFSAYIGQSVSQANTNAIGLITDIDSTANTLTLTNVKGLFNTTDKIKHVSSSANATCNTIAGQNLYFDQTLRLQCTNKTNVQYFSNDEIVVQPEREGEFQANGILYSSSIVTNGAATLIRLTHTRGTFNSSDISDEWLIQGASTSAQANIISQELPDLVYGTGEVLYIENVPPVTRNNKQTETFKFIFDF